MPAFHIPGYNYCGPGTWDFTKKPKNNLDIACREHDYSYQKSYRSGGRKVSPYFYFTDSDQVLMKKAKKIGGVSGTFIHSVFAVKKLIAKRAKVVPEKRFNRTFKRIPTKKKSFKRK